MSSSPSIENVLLVPVLKRVRSRFRGKSAEALTSFTAQFFASSAHSELQKSSDDYIYDTAVETWQFIQVFAGNRPKISFYQTLDNDKPVTRILLLQKDMPFIVDSVRQGINRAGFSIKRINNTVVHVSRAGKDSKQAGKLRQLSPVRRSNYSAEAICCIHCAHIPDAELKQLEREIRDILKHVAAAVRDFRPMCNKALAIRDSLQANSRNVPVSGAELRESCEFIDWLVDNHFTFLGYEEYRIRKPKTGPVIELQKKSLMGISRYKKGLFPRVAMADLPKGTGNLILKKQVCNFAKSATLSKVHRPAYYDYVLIKEFDHKGNVAIEHRFVGLYTSSVYYVEALEIPLVRNKVNRVLEQSGFSPNGHSIKDLLQVINVFPRDELFQIKPDQLYSTAIEIARIQETRTSKLFIRRDSYGKFFSCLVYLPRDNYNTRVRVQIQDFLKEKLQAKEAEFNIYLSESLLARIHFVLRVDDIYRVKFDAAAMEQELSALIKPWDDGFLETLQMSRSESEALSLFNRYGKCFPEGYKEAYDTATGVEDLRHVERVVQSGELAADLTPCKGDGEEGAEFTFKIFSFEQQIYLSEVAPILENLGLGIISEYAFHLSPDQSCSVWLHDFSVYRKDKSIPVDESIETRFEEAFYAIWSRRTDDDSFNALVTNAQLDWRDAALLRAYAAYLKQVHFGYSAQFIAETLANHSQLTRQLVQYFKLLFQPGQGRNAPVKTNKCLDAIMAAIDAISNLSEDSVLRAYVNAMDATLRTNYFQPDGTGKLKDYFSFKFDCARIESMPEPRPMFEIFVYSRQIEGVHLRGGRVARGGLRWSDRREDYRTEVLGLVKAQQVKNSVIVPVGAKGGFVMKQAPVGNDRDAFMAAGIECYKTFIRGLLDITDNLKKDKVVAPKLVVRRDEDDPYLVVAADKGTATFSDIANGIAAEYGFWLGDGFASGGSNGYDHKQMGITARGAWVSVQRHFRELGVNVQEEDFTVVGIGDMSGDVFGNGMLLSRHICLVAAFNHLHIFIDPDPDSARSYRERQRLFNLPRSGWNDYKAELISKGGGVFERSAKSISLSPQMKQRFDICEDKLTPDQLINRLLKSPVDLIWNGGIGTYVKAGGENHAEVGDKTNDGLRVDADELRCRVIGEGGNLGLTQRARVEYGINGGISITDFIDNSAGVDCSDHEVNIKILLNKLVAAGTLSEGRRDKLLQAMTDEVAALVLDNNYSQVQAIGVANYSMDQRHREFGGLISWLESHVGLDRRLEYLPDNELVEERATKNQFLTRPEIATLTSYIKIYLKRILVAAEFIDDDYLLPYLGSAFPARLARNYGEELSRHPLRREIIATQLGNRIVNQLGPGFVYRVVDSTGADPSEVVKAAVVAIDVFNLEKYWSQIEALDYKVSAELQAQVMTGLGQLMRRMTRWFLRNRRYALDLRETIGSFGAGMGQAISLFRSKMPAELESGYESRRQHLLGAGIPESLAQMAALSDYLYPIPGFIDINQNTGCTLAKVMEIYFAIGDRLQLNGISNMINGLPVSTYWQALARESYLDDLASQQRALTRNVVACSDGGSTRAMVDNWVAGHTDAVKRVQTMVSQLQGERQTDYIMFSVAMRELLNLVQLTRPASLR